MAIFDFIKKRANPAILEDEAVQFTDATLRALLYPDEMTLEKAMQIPAFAGCVNLICGTAKTIPIRLYKRIDDRIEPVPNDERVRLLNDDTGDTLTGANFKAAMMYDYLVRTGAYAYINHRGKRWYSLHYVDNSEVAFAFNNDPIFKDYTISVQAKRYEPYQFLKFIRRTRNGYRGISIVDENKTLLSAAYNSLVFENALVKKGGNKKGFLQSEHKLNQDTINTLREAFRNMYSNDSDNIPVLNDGVKFQEASNSSVELQLNENKRQNGNEICKIFNVPPAILDGTAKHEDWIAFVQYCMIPYFEDFTNALNRDLLLEREKGQLFFAADFTEQTKGDIRTRYDAYQIAIKSGFLQIDEVRKKENLPALDLPFVKLGLQDVLLDPESGGVYTPNTGMWGSIKDQRTTQEPEQPPASSQAQEPPGHQEQPDDQKGENKDEDNSS